MQDRAAFSSHGSTIRPATAASVSWRTASSGAAADSKIVTSQFEPAVSRRSSPCSHQPSANRMIEKKASQQCDPSRAGGPHVFFTMRRSPDKRRARREIQCSQTFLQFLVTRSVIGEKEPACRRLRERIFHHRRRMRDASERRFERRMGGGIGIPAPRDDRQQQIPAQSDPGRPAHSQRAIIRRSDFYQLVLCGVSIAEVQLQQMPTGLKLCGPFVVFHGAVEVA